MNFFEKTLERIALKIISRKIAGWYALEDKLAQVEGYLTSVESSPARTWPDPAKVPSGKELPFKLREAPLIAPLLRSCVRQAKLAITSLKDNPRAPKKRMEPGFLKMFEEQARALGIGGIGYTRLPRELIFRKKAVAFDRAIVLLKEMDRDKINQAPSLETFKMVFETYDSLGKNVNELCEFLREHGYNAHGTHPLAGLTLYPPLAARAGLGWHGRHGLLMTPQFGPRQRIAAIFTDIEDLPLSEENPHTWIPEFCATCGLCIRACPPGAIREEPLPHGAGLKTHIIRKKCLPYFNNHQGWTVCIKECMFTKLGYEKIHQRFSRRK